MTLSSFHHTKKILPLMFSLLAPIAPAADLIEIFQVAAEDDPQIRAAESSMKSILEGYNVSRSLLLPDVSLSANTTWNERQFDNDPTQEFNSNGYSARIVQPLLRADRWFQLQSSKAVSEQARKNFEIAKQELVIRVATAYFNILRAEDNLESAVAQETAFKRQLEQTQERFDVGLIAITDVHEAQAAYDLARVTRITQEEERDNSFAALETLTNQSYAKVDKLDKAMPITRPDPVASADWIQGALDNNLELKIRKAAVDEAKQEARRQKSGHLPTIDAVAAYSNRTGSASALGNDAEFENYSLEFNLPLFQGGGTRARVRQAHHSLNVAKDNYESQYRLVKQDIQTQHRTVSSDVLRVGAQKLALRSSQSALEATEGGYEVGTRNIVDVLQARNLVFRSESDYANSIYDYILNELLLKQTAGTLTNADLIELNQWLRESTGAAPVTPAAP